jgi:uncharacterized protein
MRGLVQLPVRFYRFIISPLCAPRCRYHPTCSAYALQALERHGIAPGILLAGLRILRCHPWSRSPGCDPVPEQFAWADIIGYKRRRGG